MITKKAYEAVENGKKRLKRWVIGRLRSLKVVFSRALTAQIYLCV